MLDAGFLAKVSHELRRPLNSIVSYSELIADERDQLPAEVAGFNDVVRRNGEYLTRLIGDLVLLAQIDAGAVALRRVPVDVAEVVEAAVRDMAPTAARHDVRLDIRAAEGPPVPGDRAWLRRVLASLIRNAVTFSAAGSTVRVTASAARWQWRISVEDRGAGIPAGELARCFDRFYRASNHASAAGEQSAGLGLCVAKALTELQGGQIVLTSTLGHGTTASVRLPLRPD